MGVDLLNVLATSQRRGAETFAYELHEVLRARGMRSEALALVAGVATERLPVPALGSRRYAPGVLGALRRRAASSSVVVGHGSSTLLACSAAMIGQRVPFVYVNIGDPRHWASTPGRRLRVGVLLRRADSVVAISPRSKDVLITDHGLDPSQVCVIPNARSGVFFRPAGDGEREAARARLRLPTSAPVLASVGSLTDEKRVDVAVRAMAELPDASLVVAGDGPQRAALESLAAAVAPGRVRFLGVVRSVADVLAAADVLVLPSDSEGVPGVLIEAGLAGVPAVATDVGFVRDVVIAGRSGELVAPGRPDAIAVAVRLVILNRDRYAANVRALCLQNFELEAVATRWQELITKVLKGRN